MTSGFAATLMPILLFVIRMLILYWMIRLAVRHAIRDADLRRRQQP